MRTYSAEFKANMIEKLLPPHNVEVGQLAQETGIPKDTLYSWRCRARQAQGLSNVSQESKAAERWSSEAKFAVVIETAALNEAELGEYCRKRGLYPEQIQSWRRTCEQANRGAGRPQLSETAQADRQRIRELERELRRKEQALAETAALLVLRKKAQAIWGEAEDA
jgi:transposase-like protein